MSTPLTTSVPLTLRIAAWLRERFGPEHWVLVLAMYGGAVSVARHAAGSPPPYHPIDLLGYAAVLSFFLMLRVFDEHKDYGLDCLYYPERVLQRGLVTLDHLKVLGGLAIATQLGVSLFADGGFGRATAYWIPVMLYSGLMAREFFCGRWLQQRLVCYAASHLLVMPLAVVWMAQLSARQGALPLEIAIFAAGALASGAMFELTRKTRGRDEERSGVLSYSQVMGAAGAAAAIAGLVVVFQLLQMFVLVSTRGSLELGWVLWQAGFAAPVLVSLFRFARRPTRRGREYNELGVAVCGLGSYAVLIAELSF